jgi:hypothetical protein
MGFGSDVHLPFLVAAVRVRSWVTLGVGRGWRRKGESDQGGRAEDRSAKLSRRHARDRLPFRTAIRTQRLQETAYPPAGTLPLSFARLGFGAPTQCPFCPPKAAAAVADRRVRFGSILLKKSGSRVDAIFLASWVCFSEKNVGGLISRFSINERSSKPIYSRG